MTATTTAPAPPRKKLSAGTRRGIWIAVVALVVLGVILGTKVVSNDDALVQQSEEFDPVTFGVENFPTVQEAVAERATDAVTLAEAIAADPEAAAAEYGVESSGGQVYSVTFTGIIGEGQSGIYTVDVEGLPDDLTVRMQTGPAINGTELRDATGEVTFGQFTNQIDYQDAAAALNEELKTQVLSDIDTAALQGKTVTVTGVFTLINPASWLITPTELDVS